MTKWIKLSVRAPTEEETIDGRVPILDKDGYLGYAILVGGKVPELMSEFDIEYWTPVNRSGIVD